MMEIVINKVVIFFPKLKFTKNEHRCILVPIRLPNLIKLSPWIWFFWVPHEVRLILFDSVYARSGSREVSENEKDKKETET